MADKATMNLNLAAAEMEALKELAVAKEMSKTAVIRQALRLYQYVDSRQRSGYEMAWKDKKTGKYEGTVLVGCGVVE